MHADDPVNRIMSQPVLTVAPDTSAKEMLQLFAAHSVHHLPVVRERRVVGMISSADLLKLEFFLPPPGAARDALLGDRFAVAKVMRTPVATVTERESVQRAAELMAKHGIHSLPVVNHDGQLVGIVTTTDLMRGCLRTESPPDKSSVDNRAGTGRLAEISNRAQTLVDGNSDPNGMAEAILRLAHRTRALEQVATAAKRYVNAGQDERLHAALQKAIEQADRAEQQLGRPFLLGADAGE